MASSMIEAVQPASVPRRNQAGAQGRREQTDKEEDKIEDATEQESDIIEWHPESWMQRFGGEEEEREGE